MSDVFDEDLMRELGIEPEDMVAAVKRPTAPVSSTGTPTPSTTTASVAAQNTVAKAQTPTAKPPGKLETSFTTDVSKPTPVATVGTNATVGTKTATPTQRASAGRDDLASYNEQMTEKLPVHVAAVLAKKSLTLKEIMDFRSGDVVSFDKMPDDPIDLVVNGKLVAKAELVLVDGRVATRILKLVR